MDTIAENHLTIGTFEGQGEVSDGFGKGKLFILTFETLSLKYPSSRKS